MLKRSLDLLVAGLGLLLFGPLILVLCLLIRRNLGSPVFFRQMRPGLRGEPFRILKFRTMTDERGPGDHLLPDAQRLTPFAKWLRSTSLDELPELWNIVVGDMSVVGPRPLLMQYLPLYSERQRRRHEVRPGITGWAQINGRNTLDWDERFELDVWYVEHQSFWLDFRIFWLTFALVARREGISAAGEATMTAFRGNACVFDDDPHCRQVPCSPEVKCRGSLAAYAADGNGPPFERIARHSDIASKQSATAEQLKGNWS